MHSLLRLAQDSDLGLYSKQCLYFRHWSQIGKGQHRPHKGGSLTEVNSWASHLY